MILQSHRALQAKPKDSNTVKRSSVVTKVHIHALVLTEPGRRCGRARLCRSAGGEIGHPEALPRTAGGGWAPRGRRGACPWVVPGLVGQEAIPRASQPL